MRDDCDGGPRETNEEEAFHLSVSRYATRSGMFLSVNVSSIAVGCERIVLLDREAGRTLNVDHARRVAQRDSEVVQLYQHSGQSAPTSARP